MSNDKISNNENIDAALRLDGDPESIRDFYEDWAARYDLDTAESDYSGPRISARLLAEHQPEKHCRLLDAGCGTGQVGVELRALGFDRIDGFDLSDAMADRAREQAVYQEVRGGVDMMLAAEQYSPDTYDAVLSIGVFTLGHVPPEALQVLLELIVPRGLVVVSTRTHYYDETHFQQQLDDLFAAGRIKMLQALMDAPYNVDGDGHYWVLQKQ